MSWSCDTSPLRRRAQVPVSQDTDRAFECIYVHMAVFHVLWCGIDGLERVVLAPSLGQQQC